MFALASTVLLGLLATAPLGQAQAPAGSGTVSKRLVHQYPMGAWIESLAVRADGTLLATQASAPHLFAVNPTTGASTLVRTFAGYQGLVGITETTPDVFYLLAGNFSLATFTGTPGSFALFKVDYTASAATRPAITKFVDLPTATFPDGLTAVGATKQIILAADLNAGRILGIDLPTKAVSVVSADPLLGTAHGLGVDGLKTRNGGLYFTNPGQGLVGRMPIDVNGQPTGPASVVQPIGGDDLAIDRTGSLYSVGGSNNLTKIYGANLSQMRNLTMLPGPTAAQFGRTARDGGCLYVTTCGGDAAYATPPVTVPGGIYAVDVFQNGSCAVS